MDDVVQIQVGRNRTGIVGLKQALAEIADEGRSMPDDVVGKRLSEALSKQNYIPESAASKYEAAFVREYRKFIGAPVAEAEGADQGLRIKVLGQGCAQCERLTKELMAVMAETGIVGDLEHVRDLSEIGRYGVMGAPALFINGEVKAVGSVPPKDRLRAWIEQAASKTST